MLKNAETPTDILVQISTDLTLSRPLVRRFMTNLLRDSRLKIDIDSWTEESHTSILTTEGKSTYEIQLGIQPISDHINKKLVFLETSFSAQELIQYRLLHEIAHVLVNELVERKNSLVKTLLNICEGEMRRDGRFFTGLASYKGTPQRGADGSYELPDDFETIGLHEEEATELLAMHLWSAQYLGKYMKFLSSPEFHMQRRQLNLRSLSVEHAEALQTLIEEIATQNPFNQVEEKKLNQPETKSMKNEEPPQPPKVDEPETMPAPEAENPKVFAPTNEIISVPSYIFVEGVLPEEG